MKKWTILVLSGVVLVLSAVCYFSCGESAYVGLAKKAGEVDSLIIKARAAGKTNRDSLAAVKQALAIKYIEKINPDKVLDRDKFDAARLFFAAGKIDTTITLLQNMDILAANDLLFEAYLQKERVEDAEALFTQGIKDKAGENAIQYFTSLFYGYQEAGKLDQAITIADAAIAATPPEVGVSLAIDKADLLHEQGKKDQALVLLKELKAQHKENAMAMRGINAKWNLFNLIGSPAPELKISIWIDSKPVAIKDLRGKVVLLDFWAPWCGPCRAMFPHIKKLYAEYHDKGLEIIGITRYYGRFNQLSQNLKNISPAEELEWIKKFKKHHEMPIAYAIAEGDAALANEVSYGVYGIPHMLLIDKKGKVRLYTIGSGKSSEVKLDKGVAELLSE